MQPVETSTNAVPPLEVVVVGEALIDIVESASGTTEHPGGSPANVAYGLGRLGVATGLLTALGTDARGTALRGHLHRAKVAVIPGSSVLDRTATATVSLGTDGSASYLFDIDWKLDGAPSLGTPPLIHTGSIATFLEPGAGAVKALLRRHRPDSLITYDPNIRPALLGTHAQALSSFEEIAGLAHLVKLSDEDARWLYPGLDIAQATRRILRLGPDLVVVTRGAEGSLLATEDGSVVVPSVKTTVVDTIGAGDSYMAALVAMLVAAGSVPTEPGALEELGRTASMAAAITVGRAGANPPRAGELEMRLARESARSTGTRRG